MTTILTSDPFFDIFKVPNINLYIIFVGFESKTMLAYFKLVCKKIQSQREIIHRWKQIKGLFTVVYYYYTSITEHSNYHNPLYTITSGTNF